MKKLTLLLILELCSACGQTRFGEEQEHMEPSSVNDRVLIQTILRPDTEFKLEMELQTGFHIRSITEQPFDWSEVVFDPTFPPRTHQDAEKLALTVSRISAIIQACPDAIETANR